MKDILIYVPNDDKQEYSFCRIFYWLKRLVTPSLELSHQNSLSVPKVF